MHPAEAAARDDRPGAHLGSLSGEPFREPVRGACPRACQAVIPSAWRCFALTLHGGAKLGSLRCLTPLQGAAEVCLTARRGCPAAGGVV